MACVYDSVSHLLICTLYINSSNACTVLCRTLQTRDTYSSDNGMKSEWSTLLFVTHLFWRSCCRLSYTTRCAWSTTSRYTCKVCMLQVIVQILIFLVRKSEVFGILVMLHKKFCFYFEDPYFDFDRYNNLADDIIHWHILTSRILTGYKVTHAVCVSAAIKNVNSFHYMTDDQKSIFVASHV